MNCKTMTGGTNHREHREHRDSFAFSKKLCALCVLCGEIIVILFGFERKYGLFFQQFFCPQGPVLFAQFSDL